MTEKKEKNLEQIMEDFEQKICQDNADINEASLEMAKSQSNCEDNKCHKDEPETLTMLQIKEKYGFDVEKNLVNGESIPQNHLIQVINGKNFSLHQVGIKKHVPNTDKYMIYEYKSPFNRRVIRLLNCTHEKCSGKIFRKWHNFFDHLRIHTNERPYLCTFKNCQYSFT